MKHPVSVIIPALEDTGLFERHLPPLLSEFDRRKAGDEVIVVDDSGKDVLRSWFEREFPRVKGVVHKQNRGFGRSLLSGVRAAKHDLLLCLHPGIRVRKGCLDPLTNAMQDEQVFAASPRVFGAGDADQVLSLRFLRFDGGLPAVAEEDPTKWSDDEHPITALGGPAFMLRREALKEAHAEALFEPFHFDTVDFGLGALRAGRRVLEVASAGVEFHPADPAATCPEELLELANGKNLLLAFWKHLHEPDLAKEHLARLWDVVLAAAVEESLEELEPLVLALEQLPGLAAARQNTEGATRELREALQTSTPSSLPGR